MLDRVQAGRQHLDHAMSDWMLAGITLAVPDYLQAGSTCAIPDTLHVGSTPTTPDTVQAGSTDNARLPAGIQYNL
jgi:hypothetical protein